MASSSPLSTPDTPRTSSPFPPDEALTRPRSPAYDDAHPTATKNDVEPIWVNGRGLASAVGELPTADEACNKTPKGKEKAVKGPLRLLDLPVDVLKEIIHQVGSSSLHPAMLRCVATTNSQQ